MKLSPNFTLEELTRSQTAARKGIDNTPPAVALASLERLAAILEQVRALCAGNVVHVTSGYRCAELNTAIGGSRTSGHLRGLAADFSIPGFGSPLQVCKAIRDEGVVFDQLIHEFGRWVHLGLAELVPPRNELLTAVRTESGTHYRKGLLAV